MRDIRNEMSEDNVELIRFVVRMYDFAVRAGEAAKQWFVFYPIDILCEWDYSEYDTEVPGAFHINDIRGWLN